MSTIVEATFDAPPGSRTGNRYADCPAGTTAVGGGFAGIATSDVRVYQSEKTGDSWAVAVFNHSAQTVSFTVDALCMKLDGNVVTTSNVESINAKSFSDSVASCPPNTVLLGGGFEAEDMSAVNSQADYVTNPALFYTGWNVYASNSDASAHNLKTFAYCYDGQGARSRAVEAPQQVRVGPNGSGSDFSSCPNGSVATGGGARYFPLGIAGADDPVPAPLTKIWLSRPVAGGWSGGAHNASAGSTYGLDVVVQCVTF